MCILLYDSNTLLVACSCAKRQEPGWLRAAEQLQEQQMTWQDQSLHVSLSAPRTELTWSYHLLHPIIAKSGSMVTLWDVTFFFSEQTALPAVVFKMRFCFTLNAQLSILKAGCFWPSNMEKSSRLRLAHFSFTKKICSPCAQYCAPTIAAGA